MSTGGWVPREASSHACHHGLKQGDSAATGSRGIFGPPIPPGPYLTCFHGAATSISSRSCPLLASLSGCLRRVLGLGRAVLAFWASARGSRHTLSSAVRHWAQWACRRRLCPACWNWVMVTRWTRPWAADWAQIARTLGKREEPTLKAIRARALQEVTSRQSPVPCCAPPTIPLCWRNQVKMGKESS